ncbi:MAG TPA: VOC family protein [Amycolatopsis sp.]|nr:VOC family protein [Amycolatopsis sp.]
MSTGYLGLAPYLYYADATAALAWLTRTFGFTEDSRICDATGEVFQATLCVGERRIQVAGVGPDYWAAKGVDGPVGQLTILYVEDVDECFARVSAILGDETELEPPTDQPYGARVFTVADPGGNSWTFWQQVSDDIELPPGWQVVRTGGESSNG